MAPAINPLLGSSISNTAAAESSSTSALTGGAAPTEEMFQKLLVRWLRAQVPVRS